MQVAVTLMRLARILRNFMLEPAVVVCLLTFAIAVSAPAQQPERRAVIPMARNPVVIDGQLDEADYASAFCSPIEYFHADSKNRPAHFYYLWDDQAFYVGLRTLDEHQFSPLKPLWEGDAVEWYIDTRRGSEFLSRKWSHGASHCFFTPMEQAVLKPRFTVRPGQEGWIPEEGIEVAAQKTETGLEVEFRLPWACFPDFNPEIGEVIGLDAELSYSDGGPRSYRSFVFGNPLSVATPSNLSRVELVDVIRASDWKDCGPVLMPIRVDVPWQQPGEPQVVAKIAIPPTSLVQFGKVEFHVQDLYGRSLGIFEAGPDEELAGSSWFRLRTATWPLSLARGGAYYAYAVVFDAAGQELTRVAPRMISVNMQPGY